MLFPQWEHICFSFPWYFNLHVRHIMRHSVISPKRVNISLASLSTIHGFKHREQITVSWRFLQTSQWFLLSNPEKFLQPEQLP
jgi:hypothetical protein